jgi:ribosomal protein L9
MLNNIKNKALTLYEFLFARGTAVGVFEKTVNKLEKIKLREERRAALKEQSIKDAQAKLDQHNAEKATVERGITGYAKLFGMSVEEDK